MIHEPKVLFLSADGCEATTGCGELRSRSWVSCFRWQGNNGREAIGISTFRTGKIVSVNSSLYSSKRPTYSFEFV
jgi:hypothetical protein